MELAKMMRKARLRKDVTLKEAAAWLKISQSHLHGIESGRIRHPKMRVLYMLSAYYDLDIHDVCVAAYRIPMDIFDMVAKSKTIMKMLRNCDLLECPENMQIVKK